MSLDLLAALDARIREIVAQEVEARLADLRDWVDQDHSPIAKRAHIALAKSGTVKSARHGKRVLIWRADLNAYLARFPVKQNDAGQANDTDEIGDMLKAAGFVKGG